MCCKLPVPISFWSVNCIAMSVCNHHNKKPQCNAMVFLCLDKSGVCFSKRTETVRGHGFQMIDARRELLEIRRFLHTLWLDNVRSVVPLQKHSGRMLTSTPRHAHLERAAMMSTQCVSESRHHPVMQYLTVSHSLQEHSNAFAQASSFWRVKTFRCAHTRVHHPACR